MSEVPSIQGVVAVIVRERKLLVIRRSQTVRAAGKYCFPGGAIEPGESEETALIRELMEELAVTVRPVRLLWRSTTPWGVSLAWWEAELDPAAVPLPHEAEVESYHWLSAAELRGLPELLESNHGFLDALERGEFSVNGLSASGT